MTESDGSGADTAAVSNFVHVEPTHAAWLRNVSACGRGSANFDVLFSLAYHGDAYVGWQQQAGTKNVGVEDVMCKAFADVCGASCTMNSASRTDAGVHAKSLLVRSAVPLAVLNPTKLRGPDDMQQRLNAVLPSDVRITHLRWGRPSQINIRNACEGKQYSFYIRTGAWHASKHVGSKTSYCGDWVDVSAMATAISAAVGTHDFDAFASARRGRGPADPRASNTVRTVASATVSLLRPSECRFDLSPDCLPEDAGQVIQPVDLDDYESSDTTNHVIIDKPTGQQQVDAASASSSSAAVLSHAAVPSSSQGGGGHESKRRRTSTEEHSLGDGGTGAGACAASNAGDTAAGIATAAPEPSSSTAASHPAPDNGVDERCIIRVRLTGPGFLKHMVRRLVGAALRVGAGKLPVTYIRDMVLAAGQRKASLATSSESSAGPSGTATDAPVSATSAPASKQRGAAGEYTVAPGRGLWLEKTFLPADIWSNPDWCNNFHGNYITEWGIAPENYHPPEGGGTLYDASRAGDGKAAAAALEDDDDE